MANKKLLQEAIQAFANNEQDLAAKKMRKYFLEAAQEINKELEEAMEEEDEICEDEEVEDEEVIEEDFNTDPSQGLTGEIQYDLSEEDESEDEVAEFGSEESDDGAEEFGAEEEVSGEAPSGEEWESIKDAFADLEDLFDRIGGEEDFDLDAESDGEGDAEAEVDFDMGDDEESEFGDVSFGDEKVGEGYKMKSVAKPSNTAEKSKSPVAPNAKSPVDGVAPVKIKDGTVTLNDGDKLKNKDAETAKVDDMNNVMDSAKGMMKDAKKPTNKAEKSRSPLPKNAPKF